MLRINDIKDLKKTIETKGQIKSKENFKDQIYILAKYTWEFPVLKKNKKK